MSKLSEGVDAAIRASGKTGKEIAEALDVDPTTVSRLRQGKEDNPKLQLLIGIARETKTPLTAVLGESFEISPADEQELLRFHGWIEEKLRNFDALREPNAEIVPKAKTASRERRVADRPEIKTPLGVDADIVLRAIGDSMIADGILPDDTLYAIAHRTSDVVPAGKLIACRIGNGVFVKRLSSDSNRLCLFSAHPRYRAIELEGLAFEILGVIIGRIGQIRR